MSKMKDFAIELENAGIDYSLVSLEDAEALQQEYHYKTGHTMTLIGAIMALYNLEA